jgi:hypothetical protein
MAVPGAGEALRPVGIEASRSLHVTRADVQPQAFPLMALVLSIVVAFVGACLWVGDILLTGTAEVPLLAIPIGAAFGRVANHQGRGAGSPGSSAWC